jgi:hypothetical protein
LSKPSFDHKVIAKAAASAFGGCPNVDRYWDESRKTSVDIVSCKDSPWSGVTSYSTVGVSDIPLFKEGEELKARTELVGACGSKYVDFPNYLSTAAFFVINSGWFVAPGIIFPDVLAMYNASKTMKHFLFLPPFLWDERLQTINLNSRNVAWLLAIPISQEELHMAELEGVPMLEDHFEKHQIDIFNLERLSVV